MPQPGQNVPDPRELSPMLQASLCSRCGNRRLIRSGTGSVFLLCEVGLEKSAWPKYPPQPIQSCVHFKTISDAEPPTSN